MTDSALCPSCQAPCKPGAHFCASCGQRLAATAPQLPPLEATQRITLPPMPDPAPAPALPAPPLEATQRIIPPLEATQRITLPPMPDPAPAPALPPPPLEATQRITSPLRTTQDTQPIPVPVMPPSPPAPIQDEHPGLATQPGLTPPPLPPPPLPPPPALRPPEAPLPAPPAAPATPVSGYLDPVLTLKAPAQVPEPAPRRAAMWPWFLAGVGLMGLLGGGFLYMATRPREAKTQRPEPTAPAPTPQPQAAEAPAELRPYLESAAAGDTKAMRMLGAFYTYGLNVPANREEGLRWYRKAAEAGDATARQELQQLEGRP